MPKTVFPILQLSLQVEKRKVGIQVIPHATNCGEILCISLQQARGILDPVFVKCPASRKVQDRQEHTNLVRTGPVDVQERQLLFVGIEAHFISPNRYGGPGEKSSTPPSRRKVGGFNQSGAVPPAPTFSARCVKQTSIYLTTRTIPQLRVPRNIPQFLQNLLATYKIKMPVYLRVTLAPRDQPG
jgi:hypothetical protein